MRSRGASTRVRKKPYGRTVFFVRTYGFLAAVGVTGAAADACAPSQPRDYVPETHDVRSNDVDAAPPPRPGAYAYVARRPLGAIGLAGVRNMSDADARRFVDVAADEMERCAEGQRADGTLVDGAARLVVGGTPQGHAQIGQMEIAPGGAVAANALLCLVAPIKTLPFPPAAPEKTPAILLEVTWGPAGATSMDAGADARGDL